MLKIRVEGVEDDSLREANLEVQGFGDGQIPDLEIKTRHAIRIGRFLGLDSDPVTVKEIAEETVLELQFEDGTRYWTLAGDLQSDLLRQSSTYRDGENKPTRLTIPNEISTGPSERGGVTLKLTTLRILDVSIGRNIAASALSLEHNLVPNPGLYAWDPLSHEGPPDLFNADDRLTLVEDGYEDPYLILLHGTASHTKAGFGALAEPDNRALWAELFSHYKTAKRRTLEPSDDTEGHLLRRNPRVLAFDHHTLTKTPVENALDLVRSLPINARVHLLTYDSGGLIGELICRGARTSGPPFDAEDFSIFKRRSGIDSLVDRTTDEKNLRELSCELRQKKIIVERFVRIACPARGTTLARLLTSDNSVDTARTNPRLDRYGSAILNGMQSVPAVRLSRRFRFTKTFFLTALKAKASPTEVPGLEAIMPSSPFIAMLNRPDVEADADLTIIAGDVVGTGFFGRLKGLISERIQRAHHDLIVNSDAMYGGVRRRAQRARHFFHRAPEVNHFNYLRNTTTSRKIVKALTEQDLDKHFDPILEEHTDPQWQRDDSTTRTIPSAVTERPTVFVVPGIMGSHLSVNGSRVWINLIRLAAGKIRKLRHDQDGVSADQLSAGSYQRLCSRLSQSNNVTPFPYDWRMSLRSSGEQLASAVERTFRQTGQPVRIVAHSMGGLVVRAMFATTKELGKDLQTQFHENEQNRIVMLGTPNGGSFDLIRVLLGRERLVKMLAIADIKNDVEDILQVIGGFAGIYDMLPSDDDWHYFKEATWQQIHPNGLLGWRNNIPKHLERASEVRNKLDTHFSQNRGFYKNHFRYVAGIAPSTPVGLSINEGRIKFFGTAHGDGRVPWHTGRLPDIETWYANTLHGDLASDPSLFEAIEEILADGDTSRLPTRPPLSRAATAQTFEIPDDSVDAYPSFRDIEDAAFGCLPKSRHARVELGTDPSVKIQVTHGDLAFTNHPLVVGHYQFDSIIGAEQKLDHLLNGRLVKRQRLDVYPGTLGSSLVVLSPNDAPTGAIVAGLGQVGDLTSDKLKSTLVDAVVKFILHVEELDRPGPYRIVRGQGLGLSFLLIGTGGGGVSIEQSVHAIISAVRRANDLCERRRLNPQLRVAEVEIVELYEDKAIAAVKAVRAATASAELSRGIDIDNYLNDSRGGLKRMTSALDQDSWLRLKIVQDRDKHGMEFTLMSSRASVPVRMVATQRNLLDRFVQEAVESEKWEAERAAALYELLVPNEIKNIAPTSGDLVLVLDPEAAAYPWELMQDRAWSVSTWAQSDPTETNREEAKPLSIRTGMIRQLSSKDAIIGQTATPSNHVLVVGDPIGNFPELPGAQDEAVAVHEMFAVHEFKSHPVIRNLKSKTAEPSPTGPEDPAQIPTAVNIVSALFARDYRVLHLAGHGVYQWQPNASDRQDEVSASNGVTGMVLDNDTYLTAAEIDQMRSIPELVFINCCHLGKGIEDADDPRIRTIHGNRHRFAASFAVELIKRGARAVICAGWAVDDEKALIFAKKFYGEMLAGQRFGEAVKHARRTIFSDNEGPITWGAYQCYGDPDYVLVTQRSRRSPARKPKKPVSLSAAILEIDNIGRQAETASAVDTRSLVQQLDAILESIDRPDWRGGKLMAAAGHTYARLDALGKSLEQYETATHTAEADDDLKVLDELANIRARWAVRLANVLPSNPKNKDIEKLRSAVATSIDDIETLIGKASVFDYEHDKDKRHCTIDRLCMLASIYKRSAMLRFKFSRATPDDRKQIHDDIFKALNLYRAADQMHSDKYNEPLPYAALNWIQVEIALRNSPSSRRFSEAAEKLDIVATVIEANAQDRSVLWNTLSACDVQLTRALLVKGGLSVLRKEITSGYLQEWHRGMPLRDFRSIIENIQFLITLFGFISEKPDDTLGPDGDDVVRDLEWMLDQLNAVIASVV